MTKQIRKGGDPVADDASKNGNKPVLDLDALARPDIALPFTFMMVGKEFMLSDPKEIDWQDLLLAMRNPVMFLRLVLPADQHDAFFTAKVPTWKLNALMEAYQQHYGLPAAPTDLDSLPR